MKLIIFEDKKTKSLFPFCENHASFEIKVGIYTNLERILFIHKDNDGVCLIVRKEIEKIIKQKYPKYEVNPKIVPQGKCFNGRSICEDDKTCFQYIKNDMSLEKFHKQLSEVEENNNCLQINFLWDLFKYNNQFFSSDINIYKFNALSSFPSVKKLFETIKKKYESASLINEKNIIIDEDTELKAGVIIDATKSPVIIGKNVVIDIGALIQGPVFIDDNSYIAPGAKIRPGTFIGKHCKVGGEVSSSVISNFSNKVHDGFLGHSFIGEWVNIGAGTNNSNLKNNYSFVKFDFGGSSDPINTKEQFLGVFIGDYTRVGISTMFTAGTHIGLGSNVFGGGFQNKYIAPFSWGRDDRVDFDKFVITCKIIKKRRNIKMSKIDIKFLKELYNKKI